MKHDESLLGAHFQFLTQGGSACLAMRLGKHTVANDDCFALVEALEAWHKLVVGSLRDKHEPVELAIHLARDVVEPWAREAVQGEHNFGVGVLGYVLGKNGIDSILK